MRSLILDLFQGATNERMGDMDHEGPESFEKDRVPHVLSRPP
ncbi:hypothetical protein [Methylobacterium gnaphalii]|nr:hypothetical protein [Methylobacterium gnaphalii]